MLGRFSLLLSLFFILNLLLTYPKGYVLGDIVVSPTPVSVTASIDYCPEIQITPENRIPPTHNNSLQLEVWIRGIGQTNPVYITTVTTDLEGKAKICPIPANLITSQYYDILIKGLSHLRRNFPHQDFSSIGQSLDLRSTVLFAGDSHPVNDNYVNSMDISYEILNLYTSDLRADLNRDTTVNSLEFPTLISHLYQHGDI
jgi:hypothetical protein